LFIAWIFVFAYSLAMTFQYLCRQPIYAAIGTFLTIWLGFFSFSLVFEEPHWMMAVMAMLASLAATIALGWLAVKHDWGWKR
jgi:hypothetical protein